MLSQEILFQEMNSAIFWIYEYVVSCNAKGVVIDRKSTRLNSSH